MDINLCSIIENKNGSHYRRQSHVVAEHVAIRTDAIAIGAVRYQKCHQRTEETVHHTPHKLFDIEQRIGQSGCIQFWIFYAVFVRNVLLKHAQCKHRQRCIK